MAGKPWYNNGENEIQIDVNKGEIIPDGYVRGRRPRTQQENEISFNKRRQNYLNKSQYEIDLINQKRSDSLKKSYANKSPEEKEFTIQKRKATMSSKSDEEKLEYRKKLSDSTLGKNKDKTPWNKGLTKETDERVAINAKHTSATNLIKSRNIKQSNPEYFINWRKTVSDRMKENGTYGKSTPEENYYIYLIDKYGEDDVIRQYRDDRYPFDCDFYIPSEDLFIEINKHWTHGGKPFDELDLNDISKLEDWQERAKTSRFYKNAIYVWTDLDVRKQKCAKENNLNYKVIY